MPSSKSLPLVVIAGQTPPPIGGQNVMIQRVLDEVAAASEWRTEHLAFYFTPSFQKVRRFQLSKLIELVAVWWRFLRLLLRSGRPDLLIYPAGGPQTVPVVRDLLLLPLICLFCRRVVVQFHAAGVAERLARRDILGKLLRVAYRPVAAAIVMTKSNRRDPEALGISEVHVIPHRLPDENPPGELPLFPSPQEELRILYAGHLYAEKGTPELVEAFAIICQRHPSVHLVLMGEFLAPYSADSCRARLAELGILEKVTLAGVLKGSEKNLQFKKAHLFVFPSIAAYESFGLVMAEAMMWGLPLVVTDWRGNRDVAGPEVASVLPEGNWAGALAETVVKIIENRDGLEDAALRSRQRYVENFKLHSGEGDYRNLVRHLLKS